MSNLLTRIQKLADYGRWLRKLGGPTFLAGLCLVVASVVIVWPEQDSTQTLDQEHLFVPLELAQPLKSAGVEVALRPVTLVEPADETWRLLFALMPVALWLVWKAVGLFLTSWAWRAPLLVLAAPFVSAFLGQMIGDNSLAPTVRVGHIAERSGQPVPVQKQTLGPVMQQNPVADLRRDRAPSVTAFHLRPGSYLSSLLKDQAHFVLAQQAYHEARPKNVAAHLYALSGAWSPDQELAKTILGVLADYGQAHSFNVGQVATRIADGRPHQALRWALTAWFMRLGALLMLAGLALEAVGLLRQRAAKRLSASLDKVRQHAPIVSAYADTKSHGGAAVR